MRLHPALALAAWLLVPLVTLAAPLDPGPIRRIAFVVGTNDGGGTRARLRYAESDAKSVAEVVGRLGGVGAEDTVVLLAPDRARFAAELDRLGDRLRDAPGPSRRVELIFYYSGHSDEDGLLFGEERFPYRDLRARLDALPADVRIAILDSCASGAMTRRKGGTWKPPFVVDDSSKVKGHAILTSSADDEAAQESDRLQASFFTHYLLSGLRGAADVTGDGRVTLNEAYQFAFNETLARTEQTQGGAQHPAYDIQLSGTGDLVMTDLRGAGAGLRLAPELDGRVFVRDTNGRLAAELKKFAGRPVDLGLDAGEYAVTLTTGGQWYGARVRLVESRRTDLAKLQLLELPKELAQARGGTHVPPLTPAPTNEPVVETAPEPAPTAAPPKPTPAPDIPGVPQAVDEGVKRIVDEVKHSLGGDNPEDAAYDHQFVRLGIFPSLALGFPPESGRRKVLSTLQFNLIGRTDKLYGVGLGLVANIVGEDLRGAQASSGFNYVGRDGRGAQASAGFNVVGRNFEGFLGTAGFNVVFGAADGFLGAAGFNVVGGPDEEARVQSLVMAAFGFNVADGALNGGQAAAGFNVAGGTVRGVQAAAGFNVADKLSGGQLALLNIAGDVTGAQVGLINIADKVKGAQLGLVNVNDDIKGVPLGLLTFSKTGMLHPQLAWSNTRGFGASLKVGGRYVYSLVDVALAPTREALPGSYILGLGARLPIRAVYLDLDVGAGSYFLAERGRLRPIPQRLGQARLVAGWQPLSHLGVFAGVTVHVTETTGVAEPVLPPAYVRPDPSTEGIFGAVGAIAGVSF